jgi:hypothetical protein
VGDIVIITRSDISKQFDALIDGTGSREDIDRWAETLMRAQDLGKLKFEPATDEDQLWRAITYLFGVGLKTSSSNYLHSVEDFRAFRSGVKV